MKKFAPAPSGSGPNGALLATLIIYQAVRRCQALPEKKSYSAASSGTGQLIHWESWTPLRNT